VTRAGRLAWCGVVLLASPAAAQVPPPSPAPPPYSLPWLLRPATATSVIRLDTTVALYEDPGTGAAGRTLVESFIASRRASARWAPLLRVSWIRNGAPRGAGEASGTAFSNPLLGTSYVRPLPRGWRLSLFGATTLPVGAGGGDRPHAGAAAAAARAIPARSAMDNALFAVNYWTVIGGAGLARVTPGLTLQAEATVLQLTRVRGPRTQDGRRTNLTVGLHAGRFLTSRLSLGAELRVQRWMTEAAPVRASAAARETLTAAIGPRLHLRAGRRVVRPGLSYTRALDDPLAGQGYDMIQLDVPIAF
jgi:hypothetical protein